MKYCDAHPEEIDKLAKVKAQVTEVKGVMMQNIEKVSVPFTVTNWTLVHTAYNGGFEALEMYSSHLLHQVLDRGEKIELLVDKTEDLRSQVSSFALTLNHNLISS